MRKFLPLVILAMMYCLALSAQDTLLIEDFELDGEGIRYNSNHFVDSTDYWERTNSGGVLLPPVYFSGNALVNTSPQGGNYWASENTDTLESPSAFEGFLTFNAINITGESSIDISAFIASTQFGLNKWEANDSLNFDIRIDGGSWQTIGRFVGNGTPTIGGELQQDTDLDGLADGSGVIITNTFTEYAFTTPVSGSSLELRIRVRSDGTEELGIDQVLVAISCAPPVAICQNATIYLDASGNASITTMDINNGSTTDCGLDSMYIEGTTAFTCADTGTNIVSLIVVDSSGQSDTCMATVTVLDTIAPTISCSSGVQNTSDDGIGDCTFTPFVIGQAGSYSIDDNCSTTLSVQEVFTGALTTMSTFSLPPGNNYTPVQAFPRGVTNVTVTVTDDAGNSASCSYTTTIVDDEDPIASCTNTTIYLDASGNTTLLASDIDGGSTDNCGVDTVLIGVGGTCDSTFNLLLALGNGNDGEAMAYNPNDGLIYHASGISAGSQFFETVDPVGLTVGPNLVMGNTFPNGASEFFGLAWYPPLGVFIGVDISSNIFQITAAGAMTTSSTLAYGQLRGYAVVGADIYGVNPFTATLVQFNPTTGATINSFTLTDNIGASINGANGLATNPVSGEVYIIYKDASNNTSRVLGTVDVTTGNITRIGFTGERFAAITFDASGQLYALSGDGGSQSETLFGNVDCGGSSDQLTFSCDDLGDTTITLLVIDESGNESTCSATVTILDTIPPTATCNDLTVYLDNSGLARIEASDVSSGADTCGNTTITLSQTIFSCADVGAPVAVEVIVTDGSGNTDTCVSNVTVLDTIAPTILCVYDADSNVLVNGGFENGDFTGWTAIDGPNTISLWNVGNSFFDGAGGNANGPSEGGFAAGNQFDGAGPDTSILYQDATLPVGSPIILNWEENIDYDMLTFCPGICENRIYEVQIRDLSDNVLEVLHGITVYGNAREEDNLWKTYRVDISAYSGQTIRLAFFQNIPEIFTGPAKFVLDNVSISIDIDPDFTVYLDASGQATIGIADVDDGSHDACGIDTMYISDTSFACADVGFNTITLTAEDVNGNISTCDLVVEVLDTIPPSTVCSDTTIYLDASGNTSVTVSDIDGGSSDNCLFSLSIDNGSFDCSSIGDNTVTLTAVDSSGNSASCTATVTVLDTVPPTAVCQDLTVYLDETGNVSITASDVDNGSSDGCNGTDLGLSIDFDAFTCADVVTGPINFVADPSFESGSPNSDWTESSTNFGTPLCTTGLCGTGTGTGPRTGSWWAWFGGINAFEEASVSQTVTIPTNASTLDFYLERIICGNASDYLEVNIDGNQVYLIDGLGGICGNLGYTLQSVDITAYADGNAHTIEFHSEIFGGASGSNFFVEDVEIIGTPANIVTLTVTDSSGNSSTCLSNITLLDTIAPIMVCSDTTIYLDASGNASIVVADVDGGTTDNCAIDSISIDVSSFNCSLTGANLVTLSAVDFSGNNSSCIATVTVLDTIAPIITCIDTTLYLDASGEVSIDVNDLHSGNVIVEINILTDDFAQETSFELRDGDGNLLVSDAFSATVDDNTLFSYSISVACEGDYNFTIFDTFGDGICCSFGNGEYNVIVDGDTVAMGGAFGFSELTSFSTNACNANDICGIDSISADQTQFTCADVGTNAVTITAVDNNGNSSSCTANITILDTIPPVAICQNITAYLDNMGEVTVLASDVDGGSNDACGIDSLSIDAAFFTCADKGDTTVTLTVTDNNGNLSTCAALVTVADTVPPIATCLNITAYLDANGMVSIDEGDINGGAGDNCGLILSIDIDIEDFTCADIGPNTLTLTVTDVENNVFTCQSIVTVEDTIAPVVVCLNDTIYLDAAGMASITVTELDGGTTDNCALDSVSIDISTFTCNNIGANTVTLTAVDSSGNSASCAATVTVLDTIPPTAVCMGDTTIYLDGSGNASVTAVELDGGSSDGCNAVTLALDINSFDCSSTGANTVTLTVTDSSGNSSTCAVTVTILDTIPPLIFGVGSDDTYACSTTPVFEEATILVDNCKFDPFEDTYEVAALAQDGINAFYISDAGIYTATFDEEEELLGNSLVGNLGDQFFINESFIDNGDSTYTITSSISAKDISGNPTPWVATGILSGNSIPFMDWRMDLGALAAGTNQIDLSSNETLSITTATFTIYSSSGSILGTFALPDFSSGTGLSGYGAVNIGGADIGGFDLATFELSWTVAVENISTLNFVDQVIGTNCAGDVITRTWTATDPSGNVTTETQTLTAIDTVAPVAVCKDTTLYLNAAGFVTITAAEVDGGSSDDCNFDSVALAQTFFTCNEVGANLVNLVAVDKCGNTDTCVATVTILDTIPPVAVCQNITAYLDNLGEVTITTANVDGGSNDACGIDSLSIDAAFFTCAEIGDTIVTLTVTDNNGNMSTCTAVVTVVDTIPPTVVCNDITVYLDATGNVSITAADIDGGSGDNCGVDSIEIDISSFTCADIGANTVVLTVTDDNGLTISCTATVTVLDTIPPTALCTDITVYLDSSGNVSIIPADVDGGSNDNCGTIDLSIDIDAFSCAAIGGDSINTVADPSFESGSPNSDWTESSTNFGTPLCTTGLCGTGAGTGPRTGSWWAWFGGINAFEEGSVSQTVTIPANATTLDFYLERPVCGNASDYLEVNIDGNQVYLIDGLGGICGNIGYTLQSVDITAFADGNIHTIEFHSEIFGGASGSNFFVEDVQINTPSNIVTLTVTDSSGNSSTCTATVTILDTIAPTMVCSDTTIYLDASGNASIVAADIDGGITDNCAIDSISIDVSSFDCSSIGANSVTLTAVDASGNNSSCIATVTVVDTIAPVFTCIDTTLYLDANGQASINAADLQSGTVIVDVNILTDNFPGETTWELRDEGANIIASGGPYGSTNLFTETINVPCGADYTFEIFDSFGDGICCSFGLGAYSVLLDGDTVAIGGAFGFSEATVFTVDPCSANDACGIDSISADVTAFTCADIGTNAVTITAVDVNGNSASCTATVTVLDTLPPVALCQDFTVQLDASGNGSITVNDIDNGTTDNCALDSISLDADYSFDCSSVGTITTVALTAVDSSGNTSSCTAEVTVEDNILPVALCQNITIYLDGMGIASIMATDVDAGSNDACGIDTLTVDIADFTCADIGANNVTLTATDVNGNAAECIAIVTVVDTIAPIAVCQDATVYLDATGMATVTGSDVDGGSTDNCGIESLQVNPNSFTCADLAGAVTITLTVTDSSSNSATCTSMVTVLDTIAPILTCPVDTTITANTLGCSGIYSWMIEVEDNCPAGLMVTSNYEPGDIFPLGTTTVNYTATDGSGNESMCSFDVTVVNDLDIVVDSIEDVSCFGGSDGEIYVTVIGGTAPYEFRWSNNIDTEDITNLSIGEYVLFIEDANGCTFISDPIFVGQPTLILESTPAVITDANCNGEASGSIDVTISGGTPPYSYLWNNGSTDEDLTGVKADQYQVTVTDANGCVFLSSTYTIGEPTAIAVGVVQITNVDCNSDATGAININVTGGISPYTFLWSDGSTDEDLSGAPAGDYSVEITDDNGCSITSTTYTITERSPIEITVGIVSNAECNGEASGAVNISVSGGQQPYTYLWSNGELTQDISGLSAGTYSVVITDALGCTLVSAGYTVDEPTAVVAGTPTITEILCNGAATGSIAFSPSGGTPPYTYQWSDGSADAVNDGLVAGTYSVTIFDVKGCSVVSEEVTLDEPTALSFTSITVVNVGCNGAASGEIDIEVEGGTPGYTYLWSNGFINEDLQNLEAGDYTVQVFDVNGCELQSETITIENALPITEPETPFVTNVGCNGGSDGAITVFITGGSLPYQYLWDNGDTTQNITDLEAGTYTLSLVDASGCTYQTAPIVVGEPDELTVSNAEVSNVLCFEQSTGAIDITVTGGTQPYSFLWSNGATTEDLSDVESGTYSATITDAKGCEFTTADIVIDDVATSAVEVTFDIVPSSGNGVDDGSIIATATGGSGSYSYEWQDGFGNDPSLTNVTNGTYCIEVLDTDGCLTVACGEIGIVTGISDVTLINNISLYPNPSSDYAILEINLGKKADVRIELLDALGRQVKSFEQSNTADILAQFDVRLLPSGTYFFHVIMDNQRVTLPLVVTK